MRALRVLVPAALAAGTALFPALSAARAAEAPAPAARPAVKGLSREIAAERARRVSQARYELFFHLNAYEPVFQGAATLRFRLKDASAPLTIDFEGGSVASLIVNGRNWAPDHNGLFLTVPAAALREGANEVRVDFIHPYSQTGAGLYRFIDPADGRPYLYTDFEPYDANQLFPCFDQPDLKASYTLRVEAPGSWKVISSVFESDILPASGGRRLWVFPESKRFSTYIFSLHAGEYHEWKSAYKDTPLRLYARRSLAEFVPVDEWFRVTRQGLEFYERYFDYLYPFVKYDQVIVPDFNSGAMENVAAVTFSERYLQRGKPTWRDRERLANVVLHEMAHMWFGDLVTMQWWDDLWLNESFASYMADLALAEATEFKDAWQVFFSGTKQWAYWEDQLVTTHPIEAAVPDTEQAFSNFDGITYGKGASTLKQAAYYIGERAFRDGVRDYFKKHAYGNTRRKDFVAALERSSRKELGAWTEQWLRSAGLNSLAAEYGCAGGKISSFALLQSAPPEHPALRQHKTEIGLFGEGEGGALRALKRVGAGYSGERTAVPALAGEPCPALVYPNAGDHDYAKVRLDARSLAAVKAKLSSVADELDRVMLWTSLWNMVEHAELGALEYASVALEHLPREGNFQTAAKVLETLHGRRLNSNSVLRYTAAESGPLAEENARLTGRLEAFYWERLGKAEPGSDWQKLWLDGYLRVARSPEALERLKGLLSGQFAVPGLPLDQDRRWAAVSTLNRRGAPGSAELLEAERARDGSRRGQTAAIGAEALRPDWEAKRSWLERVHGAEERPLAELRAAMENLFPYEQIEPHRRFAEEFFRRLPELAQARPSEFLETYAEELAPATCREEDGRVLQEFLAKNAGLTPVALKPLRVAAQENGRCVKARALAASAAPAAAPGR